jgi:hypothetical protein
MLASLMTDDELIEQLEDASLSPDSFHHPEHVRAAFLYLRRYPPMDALQHFCNALRHFAAAMGKADRYHETITWSYVFLVRQRMTTAGQSWAEFAAANPDLLDWKDSILKRYYSDETLASEKARSMFVLPDRLG